MSVDPKLLGGCEGPESPFIKLISSDGQVFIVKREMAMMSTTIMTMLSGPGKGETNEVYFREITSHILQKICHYFNYKKFYSAINHHEIPEFEMEADTSLDILMAAHFLGC